MQGAGVVRLGRVGEEAVTTNATWVLDRALNVIHVQRQVGVELGVAHASAVASGDLAQAVHRVVVARGEHQLATFPHVVLQQQDRRRSVGCEDDLAHVRVCVEVVEHVRTCLVHELHRPRRGCVVRVRVAQRVRNQELRVLTHELRGGLAATRPIGIHTAVPPLELPLEIFC